MDSKKIILICLIMCFIFSLQAVMAADVQTNDTNDTKDNSSDVNAGDVLHKQSLVISGNSSDQYQGMESGTYIVYYTGNDGIIKIEKVI